ncbi:unnamed protein product [Acanthosepion pharaonis]|uniref:Uncharacterized protein n=1 Tax=Acanthosepion pharaonis TaxID=158019 RepID=A0A812C859_ACAPH|nr:unnamed protein product [Sepia pharaonis]
MPVYGIWQLSNLSVFVDGKFILLLIFYIVIFLIFKIFFFPKFIPSRCVTINILFVFLFELDSFFLFYFFLLYFFHPITPIHFSLPIFYLHRLFPLIRPLFHIFYLVIFLRFLSLFFLSSTLDNCFFSISPFCFSLIFSFFFCLIFFINMFFFCYFSFNFYD